MFSIIFGFLVMLILTIGVFFSFEILLFKANKQELRVLFSFILLISQIIISETILGLLGLLTSLNLVVIILLPLLALYYYLLRKGGKRLFIDYKENLKKEIKSFFSLAFSNAASLVLTFLAVLVISWIVFLGMLFPVTDVDGNGYHLPFIASAIQNESILNTPSDQPWVYTYPKSAELLQMWTMIFSKNDLLVDLVQIPFALLAVYCIYKIALKLGADKNKAYFSSLLFLFIPIISNQLKTTYVDVIVPALFLAGLLVSLGLKKKLINYFILGLISALLISLKITGVLFVIGYSPFLLADFFSEKDTKEKIKKVITFATPVFIIGFYWYFKNLLLFKNPIYPFGISLFGFDIINGRSFPDLLEGMILPGVPKGFFARIWFSWTEQKDWWGCLYNYDSNYSGLGPLWFVFLLPGYLVGTLYSVIKKEYNLLTLSLVGIALFLIYPGNYLPRYTIFIVAIGIILFARLTSAFSSKKYLNILYFSIIVVAFSIFLNNLFFCNFTAITIQRQLKQFSLLSKGPFYSTYFSPTFTYINENAKKNETVVYGEGLYHIYPLWNNTLSNKVIYYPEVNEAVWGEKC
jgi:hypothetical protein